MPFIVNPRKGKPERQKGRTTPGPEGCLWGLDLIGMVDGWVYAFVETHPAGYLQWTRFIVHKFYRHDRRKR